jgi:hypothetical protein
MIVSPLVTIGIPVYNAGKWLRQCIESALGQDWAAKEIIVFDDGSTDDSREIIESFGAAIRMEFRPHGGSNRARNAILAAATGEWILFLDADDYLLPQKVSQQMAEAGDAASADLLVSPVLWEDFTAGRQRFALPDLAGQPFDARRQVLLAQAPQTSGFLWRKSALERIGAWNEAFDMAQEMELFLRAIEAGLRMVWTPSAGAVYRYGWSDRSVGYLRPAQKIAVLLQLALQMMDGMKPKDWPPEHDRPFAEHWFQMVRRAAALDLRIAARLDAELRRRGIWVPEDPGRWQWASPRYAWVYRRLGLVAAELLARGGNLRRKLSSPQAQ